MKSVNIFNKIGIICLTVVLILSYNYLLTSAKEIGGGAAVMLGVKLSNKDNLNKQLNEDGISTFDGMFASYGAMAYFHYNNFVFSPEFGTRGQRINSGDFDLKFKGSQWLLNFGYTVVNEERAKGFILIGAGMGNASIDFTGEVSDINFAEAPIAAGDKIEANALLINVCYSYHFLLNFSKKQDKKHGVTAGLRAGYIFAPGSKKWKHEGIEITEGPKEDFKGAYIRLSIGGWLNRISE